ncbi:MAG TPA: hypothetical protein VFX98_05415, partial [Longimicrobiaceae bacterium]|nr:hypothetical protein [Longimicrobiaceae bacterium]
DSAAAFAWREFIALNWPAVPQTGAPETRDKPDTTQNFGSSTYTGPLVWHTFRAKVEIFPPAGSVPNGYVYDPARDYGYDAPPQYTYGVPVTPFSSSQGSDAVPWINLDENDEIGQDAMFAGNANGLAFPGTLILFMAKANRAEYVYVAQNNFFDTAQANPAFRASAAYVRANRASPPAGGAEAASLPFGTIEIKAAWRRLTPAEVASGRFYRAPVRFYRQAASGSGTAFVDDTLGLIALHIIHKTPSRPHFVFATFEQADNLLDAQGDTVEDVYGNVYPQYQNVPPTDPMLTPTAAQMPSADTGYTPTNVQSISPLTAASVPGSRLYYINSSTRGFGYLPQGPISVNRRLHSIPPAIVQANQNAQAAIAAYNQQNGIASSPWQFYKLVNVQYQPLDKPAGQPYPGADTATYYQANAVVETNLNLQAFSGMFQPSFNYPDTVAANKDSANHRYGLITDWCAQNPVASGCPGTPAAFKNVYAGGTGYNMGGCMGCHGNAQVGGGDFSFILKEVNNHAPQLADSASAPNDMVGAAKYFQLFSTGGGARPNGARPPPPRPR